MSIDPVTLVITLIVGLAIGVVIGWLASRPAQTRLQTELEKDRAVHAERLTAYHDAEGKGLDRPKPVTHRGQSARVGSACRSFL